MEKDKKETRKKEKVLKALKKPQFNEFKNFFSVINILYIKVQPSKLGLDEIMLLFWTAKMQNVSPKEISSALSFDPAKTTRTIKVLVDYHFFDEGLDEKDMRSSVLRLSPRGFKIVSDLENEIGKKKAENTLRFYRAFRQALAYVNIHYKEGRVTEGKARLLVVTFFLDHSTTISELCVNTKLKQPSVSMMVHALVNENLFVKELDSEGSFTRGILLSKKGKELVDLLLDNFS